MSRKPKGKSHAGAGIAFVAMLGLGLAGAGHGHHHHGLAGILDSLHTTPVSARSTNGNEALANRLAARRYGWNGSQQSCLDTLWQGESGFSQYADTRKSGLDPANASVFAYGIPQARPATKMPRSAWPADLGGSSNARAQVIWGLGYINHAYGSPCAALSFKQANGNQGY